MVDKFILEAVKETSKEYKDIPDYDKLCGEHAEKVEEFLKEMLHTSRPAKQKEPECLTIMTQDPELPKDVINIIKKSESIKHNTLKSGNMQIIPACGTVGHERIVKEIVEELSKRGCKEVKIKKEE